jgi:hypothetical protein
MKNIIFTVIIGIIGGVSFASYGADSDFNIADKEGIEDAFSFQASLGGSVLQCWSSCDNACSGPNYDTCYNACFQRCRGK